MGSGNSSPSNRSAEIINRVNRNAEDAPDGTALVFPSCEPPYRELTWGRLARYVYGVGSALLERGVAPGNVVLVITDSEFEQIVTFLAAISVGAIPSITSYPSTKQGPKRFMETLLPIARASGARWVLWGRRFLEVAEGTDLPAIQLSSLIQEKSVPHSGTPDGKFLQFSSGTTGLRKGVVITNDMLCRQLESYGYALGVSRSDVLISWLPLYHDMGLVAAFLASIFHGIKSIHFNPFTWLRQPSAFLEVAFAQRATLTFLPNFAYKFLADRIDVPALAAKGVRLDAMRAFVNCSEPVSAAAHQNFIRAFGDLGGRPSMLQVCYAMAEATFGVTQTRTGHVVTTDVISFNEFMQNHKAVPAKHNEPSVSFVSCGRPIQGVHVRVAAPQPERHIGEIQISGSFVIKRYFTDDLDLNQKAFTPDGWYRTGDLGYLADEELYVTGRAKDLIICRGNNIYPEDVESAIAEVPGTKAGRIAVFGVFDEEAGTEQPVAMIELEQEARDEATGWHKRRDAIRQRVVDRFGIALQDLVVVDPGRLIKSTSGKLSRGANRKLYCDTYRCSAAPFAGDGNSSYLQARDDLHIIETEPDVFRADGPDGKKVVIGPEEANVLAWLHLPHSARSLLSVEDATRRLMSLGLVGPVDIKDDFVSDNFSAILRNAGSDCLVYQFRGGFYDIIDGVPPQEFARATGLARHNLVMLRDVQGRYYLDGVSNEIPTFESLCAWLLGIKEGIGHIKKTYCIGTSMGAYAALVAGARLGVDEVWAFSPALPEGVADIAENLQASNGNTEFHIWYGDQNEKDAAVAESLRDCPRVTLHPYPTDDHHIAWVLWKEKALPRLLDEPERSVRSHAETDREWGEDEAAVVTRLLKQVLPSLSEGLTTQQSLRGILDSFDTVSLLSLISDEFGIDVDPSQINDDDLETIERLADRIRKIRERKL